MGTSTSAIWRTVDVPVAGSLEMLHDVIQAAMGGKDCPLWHVEAGGRRYGVPDRHLSPRRHPAQARLGCDLLRSQERLLHGAGGGRLTPARCP